MYNVPTEHTNVYISSYIYIYSTQYMQRECYYIFLAAAATAAAVGAAREMSMICWLMCG